MFFCKNNEKCLHTKRSYAILLFVDTPKWWNGRRDGLKIRSWQQGVGSSPTFGTTIRSLWNVYFIRTFFWNNIMCLCFQQQKATLLLFLLRMWNVRVEYEDYAAFSDFRFFSLEVPKFVCVSVLGENDAWDLIANRGIDFVLFTCALEFDSE